MSNYKGEILRYANGMPVIELKGFFSLIEILEIAKEMNNIPKIVCELCGGRNYKHRKRCINDKLLYPLKKV